MTNTRPAAMPLREISRCKDFMDDNDELEEPELEEVSLDEIEEIDESELDEDLIEEFDGDDDAIVGDDLDDEDDLVVTSMLSTMKLRSILAYPRPSSLRKTKTTRMRPTLMTLRRASMTF